MAYDIDDLLYLMARLRDPRDGCPWDLKQSYATIAPSTLEEAYEVVDTIERDDLDHLQEELGDLLFQVIFYSQLAREEQRFDFSQVVSDLVAKLVRRHPHVFPDGTLQSRASTTGEKPSQVKQRWEAIKQQERSAKGAEGLLDDVPLNLPALSRAAKLQKRAASVGFRSEERRVGKEGAVWVWGEPGRRAGHVTGVQTCALPIPALCKAAPRRPVKHPHKSSSAGRPSNSKSAPRKGRRAYWMMCL